MSRCSSYFCFFLIPNQNPQCSSVYAFQTVSDCSFLWFLAGLVCLLCFLLGFGFTSRSGNYWFTIFNEYAATFSLLFIVFIEVVSVCYIYGLRRWQIQWLFSVQTQFTLTAQTRYKIGWKTPKKQVIFLCFSSWSVKVFRNPSNLRRSKLIFYIYMSKTASSGQKSAAFKLIIHILFHNSSLYIT